MTIFKKKKKEPVRLYKKEPKQPIWKKREMELIQLGVAIGIILLILLFALLCSFLVPKTYGFFVW